MLLSSARPWRSAFHMSLPPGNNGGQRLIPYELRGPASCARAYRAPAQQCWAEGPSPILILGVEVEACFGEVERHVQRRVLCLAPRLERATLGAGPVVSVYRPGS
jgi:hypothetical protein